MTEAEVYRFIRKLFSDIFMRDDLHIDAETTADDIRGWDSIRHIEIMIAVEQHFGIEFTSREFDDLRTLGDLAKTVTIKANR